MCDHVNGTCLCTSGWQGENCNTTCDEGYYGQGCESFCGCQNDAFCNPTDGVCDCEPGYVGAFCERQCPRKLLLELNMLKGGVTNRLNVCILLKWKFCYVWCIIYSLLTFQPTNMATNAWQTAIAAMAGIVTTWPENAHVLQDGQAHHVTRHVIRGFMVMVVRRRVHVRMVQLVTTWRVLAIVPLVGMVSINIQLLD